jgi:hypothetical protein
MINKCFIVILLNIYQIIKSYDIDFEEIRMNNKEDYSEQLLSLSNKFTNNNFSIESYIQRTEIDLGSVNTNNDFIFNPLYGNSQISIGQPQLIGIIKQNHEEIIQSKNKIFKEGEYIIDYSYKGYNIFPHYNYSSYNIKFNSSLDNIINCSYNFYSYYFSSISSEIASRQYSKIVNYYSLIFGLSDGYIYSIGNYSNNDKKIDSYSINGTVNEGENLLFDNNVINIFLLKYSENFFLLTQLANYSILLFQVKTTERKDINGILYHDSSLNLIYISSSLEIFNIYDAKFLNENNIIISSEKKGMGIYYNNLTYIKNIDSDYANYTSFDFIENVLYCIKSGYGLIIFNLTDYSIINNYSHTYMSKLDIFINPFNGKKFLGITFENMEIKEFFIEFYLNTLTDLILNKIFTKKNADKSAITSFMTNDDFFSFFLDSTTANIHIIRRGIFNIYNVSSYTYKLVNAEYSLLIPFYNGYDNKIYPSILANGIIYKPIDFSFFNPTIQCNFKEKGDYIMIFLQRTGECQNSINELIKNNNENITECYQTIYYKLRVLDKIKKMKYLVAIIILSVIIFICIILLILWCIFKPNSYIKILDDYDDKKK